jgi:hypothetical protein
VDDHVTEGQRKWRWMMRVVVRIVVGVVVKMIS